MTSFRPLLCWLAATAMPGHALADEKSPASTSAPAFNSITLAPNTSQQIQITCVVIDEVGRATTLPSVSGKAGEVLQSKVTRNLSDSADPESGSFLTSHLATPPGSPKIMNLDDSEIGLLLTVAAQIRGSLIELTGSLASSQFSGGAGEKFDRLEQKIHVTGTLGTELVVPCPARDITLRIRCEIAK